MIPGIGHWWFVILLIIVLIIFGPGKLPQLGGAIGQALREFRKATSELRDEVSKATATPEPEAPAVQASTVTAPPAPAEKIQEHKPESTKA